MERHLFITGPVQVGKSTLLQEAMAPYIENIGGFVSQRLIDENGKTKGFRLADLEKRPSLTAPYSPDLPDIFLTLGENRTEDLSVFEKKGIDILNRAVHEKKIILLDEIGGFELKSELFCKALRDALDKKHCIGVLKGEASASNIQGDISKERTALLDYMSNCDIINLSCADEGTTKYMAQINRFIKESMENDI